MESRTVVAWMQLIVGAIQLGAGYAGWRAGRATGKGGIRAGLMYTAIGVAMLTVGWIRYAAWTLTSILGLWLIWECFVARDRMSAWFGLIMGVLILPITITELLLDDLNRWQQSLFVGLTMVLVALVVMKIVALARHGVNGRASNA